MRPPLRVHVTSEGKHGYKVWTYLRAAPDGVNPSVHLADFDRDSKAQAHAFKNGVVRGLELATELMPALLRAEGRSTS